MIAEFIGPSDTRWRRLLDSVSHDTYHLPEYVTFAARHEGGAPIAFYAEKAGRAFLAPMLLRPLPPELEAPAEWCDATVPYGYGAPLATDRDDVPSLRGFFEALWQAARARDIVAGFFRLHPLLSLPREAVAPFGRIVPNGTVVYSDLSQSHEDLWSETRSSFRRHIRRQRDKGYTATMNEWFHYPDFSRIYHTTMRRVEAEPFYFFSDDYFADLRTSLGSHLHLISVLSPQGELAAAGVFFIAGGFAQYHLGATDDRFLEDAPSKLTLHSGRAWAKDAGASVLHFGGGVGSTAGNLLWFKQGFSRTTADAFTFRAIFDDDKYALLQERWQELHPDVDHDPEGFFPVYRRAAPQRAASVAGPRAGTGD